MRPSPAVTLVSSLVFLAFAPACEDDDSSSDTTSPSPDAVDSRDADDSVGADLADDGPSDDSSPDADDASPEAGDGADATTEPNDITQEVDTGPPHPALTGTEPASFTVRPGVEIVTALDVTPGTPITLYDIAGERLLTVVADAFGHAHFAYIPATHMVLGDAGISSDLVREGHTLRPGDGYVLRNDSATPPRASAPFRVQAIEDHPDPSFYDAAPEMQGVHYGIVGHGTGEDPQDGLNYVAMRDGVLLSAMVRFPDPTLWGDGPWPTVIEYDGYAPSDPDSPDPGSRIATLLGYVSIGVNMRGTGCSGGVFDVFSPAQMADGYDLVETIARQPFVLNGKVGMVGLSYPGIAQLYVAASRPPSLAAITPLSVIADPWVQLRPGGIYNTGFTRQWLAERDRNAAPNGQSWTDTRIAWGDPICDEHQDLRNQNLKFEEVFKALEFYPDDAFRRSLPLLVPDIEVPVYLTGAFQDEQTGPQFTEMLGRFDASPIARFVLFNGRHPDGYSPLVLARWFEFLELYVARRVPRLPDWMRNIAASQIAAEFDSQDLPFEADRFSDFADDDYDGVRAAYEAEDRVRVLFDVGGDGDQPGAPAAAFAAEYATWPPADTATRTLYLAREGALDDASPAEGATDTFEHDPDAGGQTFFGPKGYELLVRLWDIDWTRFSAGRAVAYETAPLTEDLVLGGPAYAELWVSSDADDVHLQVTLTELRPDGQEALVTTGWLRVGHGGAAAEDARAGNHIAYSYREEDFAPLAEGEVRRVAVPIPSVAHALRAGSRLRMTLSTPGRNHGTWEFEPPDYAGAVPSHRVSFGADMPSALHLTVLPGFVVPTPLPACPGLRGQPCRDAQPIDNVHADGP